MRNYSKKNGNSGITVFLVVAVFALYFVSGLVGIVSFRYKEGKCTEAAVAQIVSVEHRKQTRGSTKYITHFVYFVDNQEYDGKAKALFSNTNDKYIGIKYNPDKPKMYIVPSDENKYKSSWSTGIFFGAIGLAIIVCTFGKKIIDKKFS